MAPVSLNLEQFKEFASRFVPAYWKEAIANAGKMPPYEPYAETLEETLSTLTVTTSRESSILGGERYVLRMTATSGSRWRFIFKPKAGRWTLFAAFANDEIEKYRCDMLGAVYGKYFRSSLEQSVKEAMP